MLDDRDYMRNTTVHRRSYNKTGLSVTAILILVTIGVFFIQINTNDFAGRPYFKLFVGIKNVSIIWQVLGVASHVFMHSTNDYGHVVWNMIALYIFGRIVENRLGQEDFLKIYLGSGIISGCIWVLARIWSGQPYILVGASGAILGITVTAAMLAPNMELLLFMVIPIKMKYLVPGYALFSVAMINNGDHVAHVAHLGGLLGGFVLTYVFCEEYVTWHPFKHLSKKNKRRPQKKPLQFKAPTNDDGEVDFKTIDKILDKIGTHGMRSLTRKERRLLDRARNRIGKN